jgi:hypothetical protein
MQPIAATLVALSLFDFMPVSAPPSKAPIESFSPSGKGELTILADKSQQYGSVLKGQTRIPFLTLDLSASCDADIALSDITVTHSGLGKASDVANIYLSDGLRRISRAQHFGSSLPEATLHLQGVTLPKCGALHLTLYADMSMTADTAGEHALNILRPEQIVSSAKKTTLRFSDSTERILTASKEEGTITVRSLPIQGPLRYGRIESVARLQFTADSTVSHQLKSITLTNQADARDYDLIRFTIETRSGEVLTPYAHHMDGRTVTLDFVPSFILSRSQTIVLLVKAEVHASQGRKVDFVLEEPSDLKATTYRER